MIQSHPVTLELLAKAHQADLAAEARNNRLVREARQIGQSSGTDHQVPVLSLIRASRVRLTAVPLASALARASLRSIRRVGLAIGIATALVTVNTGSALGWANVGNYHGDKCSTFANFLGSQRSTLIWTSDSESCIGWSRSGTTVTFQGGSYDVAGDYHSSVNNFNIQYHNATGWHNGYRYEVRNAGGKGTTQVGGRHSFTRPSGSDVYRWKMRACNADGAGEIYSCGAGYLYTSPFSW